MHEHSDIVTVNAQSLLAHFDEFVYYFSCNKFDIICVTESWLTPPLSSSFVNVCRLLESSVGSQFLLEYTSICLEIVDSSSLQNKLALLILYRPPGVRFLGELGTILVRLSTGYAHVVVTGDFNTDFSRDLAVGTFFSHTLLFFSSFLLCELFFFFLLLI